MNKKGQSLIAFILFLPLIVFFLAFFIDGSMMYLEKNKVEGIVVDNLKISLKNNYSDISKIKDIIQKNDESLKINVEKKNDEIVVHVKSNKQSLFGNLFDLNIYRLDFTYCGNYLDQSVRECKGD